MAQENIDENVENEEVENVVAENENVENENVENEEVENVGAENENVENEEVENVGAENENVENEEVENVVVENVGAENENVENEEVENVVVDFSNKEFEDENLTSFEKVGSESIDEYLARQTENCGVIFKVDSKKAAFMFYHVNDTINNTYGWNTAESKRRWKEWVANSVGLATTTTKQYILFYKNQDLLEALFGENWGIKAWRILKDACASKYLNSKGEVKEKKARQKKRPLERVCIFSFSK